MLVTFASLAGVLILVGAGVGQKLPVSINAATCGLGVGAERLGCAEIPSLTVVEPRFLRCGATRPSFVPLASVPLGLGLGPCTGVFVIGKFVLYDGLDGYSALVVWRNKGV